MPTPTTKSYVYTTSTELVVWGETYTTTVATNILSKTGDDGYVTLTTLYLVVTPTTRSYTYTTITGSAIWTGSFSTTVGTQLFSKTGDDGTVTVLTSYVVAIHGSFLQVTTTNSNVSPLSSIYTTTFTTTNFAGYLYTQEIAVQPAYTTFGVTKGVAPSFNVDKTLSAFIVMMMLAILI